MARFSYSENSNKLWKTCRIVQFWGIEALFMGPPDGLDSYPSPSFSSYPLCTKWSKKHESMNVHCCHSPPHPPLLSSHLRCHLWHSCCPDSDFFAAKVGGPIHTLTGPHGKGISTIEINPKSLLSFEGTRWVRRKSSTIQRLKTANLDSMLLAKFGKGF